MTPRAAPDRETWRTLMRVALQVIDSIGASYGPLDFRLGGGTVLMFRFDHRISKDIDIFVHDAQALSYVTPRLNEVAERLVTDYEEHANVVKLLVADGDIDFIVAPDVVPGDVAETMTFDGRIVRLDTTAEILAKKLLFRADAFKARDVFDLATVLARDPCAARLALRVAARMRPALLRRLDAMRHLPERELSRGLLPTESGLAFVLHMIETVLEAVTSIDG